MVAELVASEAQNWNKQLPKKKPQKQQQQQKTRKLPAKTSATRTFTTN